MKRIMLFQAQLAMRNMSQEFRKSVKRLLTKGTSAGIFFVILVPPLAHDFFLGNIVNSYQKLLLLLDVMWLLQGFVVDWLSSGSIALFILLTLRSSCNQCFSSFSRKNDFFMFNMKNERNYSCFPSTTNPSTSLKAPSNSRKASSSSRRKKYTSFLLKQSSREA